MNQVDIRSEIYHLIEEITPFDHQEQEDIRFSLQWISSGSELFRGKIADTPNIHLVSYFVVANPEMDQLLLVDHKKAGLWLPPGGHVEPGEDPKETVKREAMEELGIEAQFLSEIPILLTVAQTIGNVAPHTDVSLWYLIKVNINQAYVYDPNEFHTVCWFPLEHIPFQKSDPNLHRFIQKMKLLEKLS